MDPVLDWLVYKNEPVEEVQNVGNIARSWQWRERGIDPPNCPPNKTVFENIAEDILVEKPLDIRSCDLPGYPRSTFLMVFSPDGTKVASTHGNHNVYVSELASGKHVRILKGHPRTPWCIAFHPSHPQLIGSGCLGGQVRVWDIASGGSEVWNVRNETVIASIAFHPREQLLVIATYNELYFWDWSQSAPFTKVSTSNANEKVRYVAFDALGYKLVTGISLWPTANNPLINPISTMSSGGLTGSGGGPPSGGTGGVGGATAGAGGATGGVAGALGGSGGTPRGASGVTGGVGGAQRGAAVGSGRRASPERGPRPQDSPGSAQDMIVNSYQNLVQRYDSLVRNYQRLFMIDRGTDPMETDLSPATSGWTRSSSSSTPYNEANPTPGTSRGQDTSDQGDIDGNSSRILNLGVLSFDNDATRERERSFGSRGSAFQRLIHNGRPYRASDVTERTTRLLPNPFSSSGSMSRPGRAPTESARAGAEGGAGGGEAGRAPHTARTCVFSALARDPPRRRRHPPPATTNSSTQMSPVTPPVDAHTINESLDLIRDILRDSGTRLLNLITSMSLSTLASVERTGPRRARDDPGPLPPRLYRPVWRRSLHFSSSDSDSDHSLEVNILRTRNSTFREDEREEVARSPAGEPACAPTPDPTSVPAPVEQQPHPTDRMYFELGAESRSAETEESPRDTGGINVSLSSSRFRVRTQSAAAAGESCEAGPSTSRGPLEADANPSRPSTSRDNFWTRGCAVPPDEAYRKVRSGVNALQKHTMQLTNMWLRGNRTTMRELRTMWENLRRRILMLHRETGRQDLPSYYTRSLLERCMILTEMSDGVTRPPTRATRSNPRTEDNGPVNEASRDDSIEPDNTNPTDRGVDSAAASTNQSAATEGQNQPSRTSQIRSSPSTPASPTARRRLHSTFRWRADLELRRRSRNPAANRLAPRYSNRSRRDFARAIEISATRHEIRMRAMQVLSVMFNMMMMCLEERGLSQLIINMLRTLKKALALTCLMLMTNRNPGRGNNPTSPSQRVDPSNVVRIQNVDHTGPVNVDGPDDPISPLTNPPPNDETSANHESKKEDKSKKEAVTVLPSTSRAARIENNAQNNIASTSVSNASQRWSNRLAVQISAANRNNSATARNRRELYLECRRMKALHRTNPTAHPLVKKRTLAPVSTHRIPAMRYLPSRSAGAECNTPRVGSQDTEPVAGPSNAPASDNTNQDPARNEMMNDFENRVNFIRIAHMQAVRLRNAARSRFRRLQTIRLYTPSSVREMFALQNPERPPESLSPSQNNASPDVGNRRSFTMYRSHILTPRGEGGPRSEEPAQFHTVLNNVAMPLVQLHDVPAAADAQGNPAQAQRLPRIHEYLQPIILAQNAMVVDEDGGAGGGGGGGGGGGSGGGGGGGVFAEGSRRLAGMAGLLDAGILSEALPAPSHRVQAWDFTTGDTPDIADCTKNVVVQRCRIHNDASIDISKDGRLLVALLPVPRLRNTNHWLGVYSLEWAQLGQCLHTAVLEQSAVSVALSPTARHLAVGLGSRRFTTAPHTRNVFALVYRLDPLESASRTGLSPVKELEQSWEHGFTSLNCLRWAPQPGQGLLYANNTGQLIIMS